MPLKPIRQIIANIRRLAADPGPEGPSRPSVAIAQTPTPSLSESPITLSLSQLDEMRAQIRTAQERVTSLEHELMLARQADPTGRVVRLQRLVREGMLPIVRFAIENLPPITIPKWPRAAVRQLIDYLHALPDFSADDAVLRKEFEIFLDDIEEHELDRARKRDALIASAPSKLPLKARVGTEAAPEVTPPREPGD